MCGRRAESFKAPDEAQATASRETLRTLLSAHAGWLQSENLLKTELVLDRYHSKGTELSTGDLGLQAAKTWQ